MTAPALAFFGSSLVSAYWNGAATYYRGIVRALHERGHRVTFYEPDAFGRQQHRDIEDPAWATVVVYPPMYDISTLVSSEVAADRTAENPMPDDVVAYLESIQSGYVG